MSTLTPMHWGIIGGALLIVLIIRSIMRNRKRRKFFSSSPLLVLDAFQIAPLGRDAFLKIKNNGTPATISQLQIKGREDILVKSAVAGHQVAKDKIYSILLEASASDRIRKDFVVELSFLDDKGNVFKQNFKMDGKQTEKPKLYMKA